MARTTSQAADQDPQVQSREELLARYRRQRALPDDRFENGGKPTPPAGYRERIMTQQYVSPHALTHHVRDGGTAAQGATQHRSFTLGQTFAIAAAMALVAGAGVGMINGRFLPSVTPQSSIANAPPAEAAPVTATQQLKAMQSTGSQTTDITKKPVATARLEVADAAGLTNSFIPLALRAEPAQLNTDMLLKISGIPEGAYLTSGRKDDDQIWSLSLADLKNVKLVVPHSDTPEIDLAVAAFEPKSGELAAPVKTMTVALSDVVVEPVSAAPPGQQSGSTNQSGTKAKAADALDAPLPIPLPATVKAALDAAPTTEAQRVILEGDSLLKSGDVLEARKTYEQAWADGNPAAAAFALGKSYDPVVVGALAIKNGKPDKAKAVAWYERAASAGHPEAAAAIVRLQLKP